MALSAGEYLSGGQVCDSQGRTVCISETAGAVLSAGEYYSGGYLRDADGRMVICQDTLNAALGAGEVYSGGDVRDSMGRVAVAVDTANAALSALEQISGGQVRDSLGRRVIAIDTLGAALSAGEFFSGGNVLDKVGRTVVALESGAGLTYDATVLVDTPISFWKMNEPSGTTATDSVGTNPGTYSAGVTLAQTGPCSDGETAVLFNGTAGFVTVADSASIHLLDGPLSLEAWVKLGALGIAANPIIGHNSAGAFELRVNASNGLDLLKEGNALIVSSTATIPSTVAFHHVVCTKNAGAVKLYLDGVDVTGTVTNSTLVNVAALLIGSGEAGSGAVFNGTMAKAAIYNTVLSPARVTAHYAAR